MILLDTNVVSEVMKPEPSATVVAWLDGHSTSALYLSSVTIAEIGFGIRILPSGHRRQNLERRFELFLARGFEHRIVGFDEPSAKHYAELMAHRRQLGWPMSVLDGQIAAIARARGFTVATGNIKAFEACGVPLANPFVA